MGPESGVEIRWERPGFQKRVKIAQKTNTGHARRIQQPGQHAVGTGKLATRRKLRDGGIPRTVFVTPVLGHRHSVWTLGL